jgi:hypothetical protein
MVTEAEWESKLRRREKHREKTDDVRQLLERAGRPAEWWLSVR